jgi:hypothetical protein
VACGFGRNTGERGTVNVNGSGEKKGEIERGSDSDSIVRGDLSDSDTMKDLNAHVESPRAELAVGMRAVRKRNENDDQTEAGKSRGERVRRKRREGTYRWHQRERFLACVVICCGVSMRSRAA